MVVLVRMTIPPGPVATRRYRPLGTRRPRSSSPFHMIRAAPAASGLLFQDLTLRPSTLKIVRSSLEG